MRSLVLFGLLFVFVLAPFGVSAHEVYVLSPDTVSQNLSNLSPNPFSAFATNRFQFFFLGFVAFLAVSIIFFASLTHRFEVLFAPYLRRVRPWASTVARVTLGICLIESAYNAALFGPELPLHDFGTLALLIQVGLYASGILLLINRWSSAAAALALLIFAAATFQYGLYTLTYLNYFGEIILALFLLKPRLEAYAFLVLRICFGASIAFAAIYGKFLHSNLALSTIQQYHLTNFFHFDPLFIVLGALIIEVLIGVFFIIGFEVRHTALFFLFWLLLSLLYFGEAVWPHIILAGVSVALFMYGYDKWTIEGRFFNRGKLQPIL